MTLVSAIQPNVNHDGVADSNYAVDEVSAGGIWITIFVQTSLGADKDVLVEDEFLLRCHGFDCNAFT